MNPTLPSALLVEDSPDLAELFVEQARVFTGATLGVETAGTLAEALLMLRDRRWGVVVVDLGLPDSSGYATFHAILDAARGAPVFVLSGRADPEVEQRALAAGGAGYLLKGAATGPDLFGRLLRAATER